MVPIVGAGLTLAVGGNINLAYVYDSAGNKGIAITGEVGVGVEPDIDIPSIAGVIAGALVTGAGDALGVETIEGTIQNFEGSSKTTKIHVGLGVEQDIDNASDTNLSIDLAVGGGSYVGYTKVIETVDGDDK